MRCPGSDVEVMRIFINLSLMSGKKLEQIFWNGSVSSTSGPGKKWITAGGVAAMKSLCDIGHRHNVSALGEKKRGLVGFPISLNSMPQFYSRCTKKRVDDTT